MSTDLAQPAADRYEIADTLHRFAFGLDHGDADSLASALTEGCVLDFRPAGKKLGLDFPKLTGRQANLNTLLPLLGPLDTSHTRSNLQIEISEDSATLYAYVMAQHFMPRQGFTAGIRKCTPDESLRWRACPRRPEMALQTNGNQQCLGPG
ncbi:MAG: nuclear transport factor 2 family protein [Chthoniobacterales bacterium]